MFLNFDYQKSLFMKRILFFTLFLTTVFPLYAATADPSPSLSVTVDIFGVVLFVAMAVHMVYRNFFVKKHRTDYTVEEFSALRDEKLTKEQVESLDKRLDSIDDIWGEIVDSSGDMVCYPHKYSTLKASEAIVAEVVAANPANKTLVEKINEINNLHNHARERQFNGSKSIIVIAAVLAIVVGIVTNSFRAPLSIVAGVVIYLFASRTSNFMLIVQIAKGQKVKGSAISRLLRSLFTGVATAKTYKTVTKYSDGTEKTEVDRSETWISLVLAIVATILLSLLLPLIAVVNYLRNYIIYR